MDRHSKVRCGVAQRADRAGRELRIRKACKGDAQAFADAERITSSEQEGFLVAQPGEIAVAEYESKILQLEKSGLYLAAETDADALVGHLLIEPYAMLALKHVGRLSVVVHPGNRDLGYSPVTSS